MSFPNLFTCIHSHLIIHAFSHSFTFIHPYPISFMLCLIYAHSFTFTSYYSGFSHLFIHSLSFIYIISAFFSFCSHTFMHSLRHTSFTFIHHHLALFQEWMFSPIFSLPLTFISNYFKLFLIYLHSLTFITHYLVFISFTFISIILDEYIFPTFFDIHSRLTNITLGYRLHLPNSAF